MKKFIINTRMKSFIPATRACRDFALEVLARGGLYIAGGVGLSKIASAILPYPTLGEINKKVVGSIFAPKIFSDTMRKGLKFFFSFKGRACVCGEETACGEEKR